MSEYVNKTIKAALRAELDEKGKRIAELEAQLLAWKNYAEVYRRAFGAAQRAGFSMHDDYGANHFDSCEDTENGNSCTCGFVETAYAFCDEYAQKVKALADGKK